MILGESDSTKDCFLAFCIPGITMSSQNLDFDLTNNKSGLNSQGALQALSTFSYLVNQVPKLSSRWSTDGSLLWNEYNTVLTQAVVAFSESTEQEKREIEDARNFIDKNLESYKQYQYLYLQALSEYNSKKLSAQFSNDSNIQQEWLTQEVLYLAKVKNAENDWVNIGKRREVESKFIIIDQITGRNPGIAWAKWKDEFQQSKLTNLNDQDFYATDFYPKEFYQEGAETQWTKLTIDASEIKGLSSHKDGSSEEDFYSDGLERSASNLSLELIQVQIIRPWLNPSVFKSSAWKFPDDRKLLSDGGKTTTGSLPAYINSIIFIRNLQITLNSDLEDKLQIMNDIESKK